MLDKQLKTNVRRWGLYILQFVIVCGFVGFHFVHPLLHAGHSHVKDGCRGGHCLHSGGKTDH